MASQALCIVKGRALLQAAVRIVTGRAADPLVGGITAAVENAIRLKPDIADAAAIGQRHDIFNAAVTTAAHRLRDVVAIQIAQFLDLCLSQRLVSRAHRGDVIITWPVARFAPDTGNSVGKVEL